MIIKIITHPDTLKNTNYPVLLDGEGDVVSLHVVLPPVLAGHRGAPVHLHPRLGHRQVVLPALAVPACKYVAKSVQISLVITALTGRVRVGGDGQPPPVGQGGVGEGGHPAAVGRRVERDDGGEVDVAQEHVEQEEHQRGEVLEPAPPAHMLQDVIEIFNWLRGSFVLSSIGSHVDLFAGLVTITHQQ